MTREIEMLGGHVAAGAGRDCIMYAGECLSADAPALFELMAESALKPRLEKLDVDNARALVFNDHQNQMKNGELTPRPFHPSRRHKPGRCARACAMPLCVWAHTGSVINPWRAGAVQEVLHAVAYQGSLLAHAAHLSPCLLVSSCSPSLLSLPTTFSRVALSLSLPLAPSRSLALAHRECVLQGKLWAPRSCATRTPPR
eukprot:2138483-Rhodomonas_salina.1